jgi:hypothetical protein
VLVNAELTAVEIITVAVGKLPKIKVSGSPLAPGIVLVNADRTSVEIVTVG